MLTGTNLKYAKLYNVRIVLETIRLYGPLSRIDIARKTELTAQTVSNITRELIDAELILEVSRIQEGRGAPSILLALNPDGGFSIGLDLDKDHLSGILVDLNGNVRQRLYKELNFPSPDEAMDLLEATARQLLANECVTLDQVWGVGVGLPGPIGVSSGSTITNVVNPKALEGWSNVPVVNILTGRLSVPVYLENNASAAALGERWYGAGRRFGTFFYVYFGAGLGGGLIINGQLFSGHTGNAGELGYMPVARPKNGLQLDRPHLGEYFNLPAMYRNLHENGFVVTKPSDLELLFHQRNPLLLDWLQQGVAQLAPLILGIEYLMDPEAIFFGGRLPDIILKEVLVKLETILPTMRIEGKSNKPELLIATSGQDAASLGVATLPLYASFAPIPKLLMKKPKVDPMPLLG
jgi:predicted NBD/HSP70 family sugar kinase